MFHFASMSSPLSLASRCPEPLDGALSQLYMEGETLTIHGRLCQDFRTAMLSILQMPDAELPEIAEQIAAGLRSSVRVTCELNKTVWQKALFPISSFS